MQLGQSHLEFRVADGRGRPACCRNARHGQLLSRAVDIRGWRRIAEPAVLLLLLPLLSL